MFSNCSIQKIKINCNTANTNNIGQTLNDLSSKSECLTTALDTLKIALSSSIAAKPRADLITYIAGILAINPPDNAIINAILEKSGLFELDLTNTTLTPSDISGAPQLLPWQVVFANGERVRYG
jgi:hypothetical protein